MSMGAEKFVSRQTTARDNAGPIFRFRTFDREKDLNPDWQGYTASLMRDGLLYCSSPREFNDPWEARAAFAAPGPHTDKAGEERFVKRCLGLCADQKHRDGMLAGLKKFGYATVVDEMQSVLANMMADIGIVSFAGKCDEPLMWSYYAGGHAGYCLQFDHTRVPICNAIRVYYEEQYPTIDWTHPDDPPTTELVVLTKAKFWVHEREYRLIVPARPSPVFATVAYNGIDKARAPQGRYLKIDPECLTGIVFGVNMKPRDTVALIELAEKFGRKIEFHEAGVARRDYVVTTRLLSPETILKLREKVAKELR